MRVALVGLAKSGEEALLGLLDAKVEICGIFSSDIEQIILDSKMDRTYYGQFQKYATSMNCPFYIIEDLNRHYEQLAQIKPDLVVIVGWPQIVHSQITESFLCLGMHPSKLPERRGGAPLNWQLIDGVSQSAVSIFRLEAGVDAGDILVQKHFFIADDDEIGSVVRQVETLTREAVAEAIAQISSGRPQWNRQNAILATYTRRRKPEDGLIHWNDSALRIYNLIRAVSCPFPGAFTFWDEQVFKVWRAKILYGYRAGIHALPAEILGFSDGCVIVSTRDNAIGLTCVENDKKVYTGKELEELYCRKLRGKRFGDKI